MSTNTQWSSIGLEFWAAIDGTEVECVTVVFTYAMSTIPQAMFVAAVGRDAHSGAASTAHALADTKLMTPVQIYAKCNNKAGAASIAMPVGKKLVFDGYITGAGLARTATGFSISFGAVHWLTDLNYGSVLSSISHPSNPGELAFNANWGANARATVTGTDIGESGETHWAFNNSANGIVTPLRITSDLWGAAIQPWLLELASRDWWGLETDENTSGINLASITLDAQRAASRTKVIDALAKIESDPALALVEESEQIASKIAEDITCQSADLRKYTLNSLATTDFWNLIISLSTSYSFSIIPFPDKVKIVPFIEGYRTHFKGDHALGDFSIAARDISNIDLKLMMPRRLGGYLVIGSSVDEVHAMRQSDDESKTVIGSFVPSAEPGIIRMHEAPRWLNGTSQATASGSHMGLSGGVTANGVSHPGTTGSSDLAPVGAAADEAEADTTELNSMLDKYAQALYCHEVLQQRSGKIVGPLRLDICPGSTIKFEGVSEKYTPGTQPIGHTRFAHVTSVTCTVHGSKVQTIYDISHIRTEKENADDATSIAGHPLYMHGWSGDALI